MRPDAYDHLYVFIFVMLIMFFSLFYFGFSKCDFVDENGNYYCIPVRELKNYKVK